MAETWERIIRTGQNVMFSMIKNTVLKDFELMTNWPLTYVSGNSDDLEPLIPNHLLLGRYNSGVVIKENKRDISSRRRWKQVDAISNQFWKRWLIEYLPKSRVKWNVHQTNIEPGTVVLLKEDNLTRGIWPLAPIIDIRQDCTSSECENDDRRIRSTRTGR